MPTDYHTFLSITCETAHPDWKMTIDDEIAERHRVVQRYTYSSTQQGESIGVPATGKHAEWSGIWIYRVAGGKIRALWGQNDNATMMQQLGMTPPQG